MHHSACVALLVFACLSACNPEQSNFPCDYEGRCPGTLRCHAETGTCFAVVGCVAPLVECDGACVDIARDASHCGGCSAACAGGLKCVLGACTASSAACDFCYPGLECVDGQCSCAGRGVLCSSVICIDTQQSVVSCGACLQPCTMAGAVCRSGQCACPGGTKACGGKCAEVASDPNNCGDCGVACSSGLRCERGVCVTSCTLNPSDVCSDGRCWDLAVDSAHCGAACAQCAPAEACDAGRCDCRPGAVRCGAECTDPASDALNCGSCGRACGTGEACVGGTCTCQGGLERCGAGCVLAASDSANCGQCGRTCAGQSCVAGACAPSCPLGWPTCDGGCVDGMNDPRNCGGCGTTCAPGETCVDGSCRAEHPALGCSSCPCDVCSDGYSALCCTRQGVPFCINALRCPR